MSEMNKKGMLLYVRAIQEGEQLFMGFRLGFWRTRICLK